MIILKLNKEYIKQIILILSGMLFIFIGYLNYSLDDKNSDVVQVSAETNDINLGDVQLVNSEPENVEYKNAIVPNNTEENEGAIVENEIIEKENTEDIKEENENYFEETRIQRERMFSEMIETYQKLVNSSETPSDQKAISVQEISNITNIKNGIMISENLIRNKGFEDVVILVNNDVVSVVVESYTLNKEQISKIQNIVERELNADIKKINISNKF